MKRVYQTPSVELEQLTSTMIVMGSPTVGIDPYNEIPSGGGGD